MPNDLNYTAGLDDRGFASGLTRLNDHVKSASKAANGILRFEKVKQAYTFLLSQGSAALRDWAAESDRGRHAVDRLERGIRVLRASIGETIYETAQSLPGLRQSLEGFDQVGGNAISLEASNRAAARRLALREVRNLAQAESELQLQRGAAFDRDREEEAMRRVSALRLRADIAKEREAVAGLASADRERHMAAVQPQLVASENARLAAEFQARRFAIESQQREARLLFETESRDRDVTIQRLSDHGAIADVMAVEAAFAQKISELAKRTAVDDVERSLAVERLEFQRDRTVALVRRQNERERALTIQQLDDELRLNDINLQRLRGNDLIADRMSVELDYAQKIDAVRRNTLLSDEERARAIDRLKQQQSDTQRLLGERGPRAGGLTIAPGAGANQELVRQVLGVSGGSQQQQILKQAVEVLKRIEQKTGKAQVGLLAPG